MTGRRWWLALLAIAAIGFGLRAWNLDFDERQHQHPDERFWAITSDALDRAPAPPEHGTALGPVLDWLDADRSPANPYRVTPSFVYGPASLAASRGAAGWLHAGATDGDQPAAAVVHGLDRLGIPLLDDDGNPRFDDAYQVDLVGRLLGVLADTLTIVVVALIGRRVGGRSVGLVAAGLAAASVLAIQHAHFLGSEPALGLAAALVVLALVHLDRGDDPRRAALGGAAVGLATGALVAMKLSGLGLALVPGAGLVALLVLHRRPADWIRLGGAALGAYVGFRVLHPGAFDGLGLTPSQPFLDDVRQYREAARADSPPSLQWADRSPLFDGLRWLFLFTVGPATFAAAVGGTVSLARRPGNLDRWTRAVLAAAWLVPLAFVLRGDLFSGRYFVPMLPALHVVAGLGVVRLWRAARASDHTARRRALGATAAALVGLSALWAVAFVAGVHGREHTRAQASRWIADHVEPGAVLTSEAWDDGLPLGLRDVDTLAFESEQLDLFGPDSVEKTRELARRLGRADYVVESSPRVWGTVTRIPARYPSTIQFFEALDDGSLGFERVATFDREPGLGPLRLPDASAEEAFSVYDHPEVRIWKKVRSLPTDERVAALDPIAAANALPITWDKGSANGAQLLPEEAAANAGIGTFDDDFDDDANPLLHLAGWLLVIELLGVATFAVVAPHLRSLPDAGAGLAKLLGLVVVTTAVFVAVTWGGLWLSAGLVTVVALGWVALGAALGWRRRDVLAALWRERRRAILQAEVVTLVAFAALLLLRSLDPDLWHINRSGEKPFELEMLIATMRTRTLPPYDPWLAGGTLNYYYGGYLLLSLPARLLRTPPELAFNLAVPTVAAMFAGVAYSAGAAVAGTARRVSEATDRILAPAARRAGLLTVAVLVLLPNALLLPRAIERIIHGANEPLDWWGLARVIPGSPAPTEFPAWSLLFADLHPHLVDIALLTAVVPLALAWHRHLRDGRTGPTVVIGLVLGGLVGAIRAVNTWDLPLAAGLVAIAILAAVGPPLWHATARWLDPIAPLPPGAPPWWPRPPEPAEWPDRATWQRWLAGGAAFATTALVAWRPYAARTEVTDAGLMLERTLHTPGLSWLAMFGFLATGTAVVVLTALARAPHLHRDRGLMALGGALVVVGLVPVDRRVAAATLALAVACGLAAWSSRRDGDRSRGLVVPLALLALGWFMQTGIEGFTVVNDFARQNTIFKGWFQSWMLLAVGLAPAVGALAAPMRSLWSPLQGLARRTRLEAVSARAWLVVGLLLVVTFVRLAVPARLDDRTSTGGLSLDGLAYLDAGIEVGTANGGTIEVADDRPLVDWLRANAAGTAVIVEYPHDDYSWSARLAGLTGLTTPVGWPYHESQQRRTYEGFVRQRQADLITLYTEPDERFATQVLQTTGARYLAWGATEDALGTPAARELLLDHDCLEVVTESGRLFIAEVDQACLADQPGGLPVATRG